MNSLKITRHDAEGIVFLDLSGRLVMGAEDATLRETFRLLMAAGVNRVALNLQGLRKIDSTGLGTLAGAAGRFREAGGALALFHLNTSHVELLILTKLLTEFEVFADERDVVSSYFPDRATMVYDVLTFVREQERDRLSSNPVPAQPMPAA